MASTVKKSKAKASPASSRTKAKSSKAKATKAVIKTKKSLAKPVKTKKSKKVVSAKIKHAEPKAPIKKAATKVKIKAKAQIKKAPTKANKATAKTTTEVIKLKEPVIKAELDGIATTQIHEIDNLQTYNDTPKEAYMDEQQLVQFKHMLEQWKRELMEEVDHTITEMKEAGVLADPNDCATQEETFSLELRTRDRERKLLKKIEEALQKIDNDEYGYCEACGVEIGIRRLEARPTATLCIDCKTLDEIKEKRS